MSPSQMHSRVRDCTAFFPHEAAQGDQSHQPAHWQGTFRRARRPNGPRTGYITTHADLRMQAITVRIKNLSLSVFLIGQNSVKLNYF